MEEEGEPVAEGLLQPPEVHHCGHHHQGVGEEEKAQKQEEEEENRRTQVEGRGSPHWIALPGSL